MSWKNVLKAESEKVRKDIERKKSEMKSKDKRRRGRWMLDDLSEEIASITGYGETKPEELDEENYSRYVEAAALIELIEEQPPIKRKTKPTQDSPRPRKEGKKWWED